MSAFSLHEMTMSAVNPRLQISRVYSDYTVVIFVITTPTRRLTSSTFLSWIVSLHLSCVFSPEQWSVCSLSSPRGPKEKLTLTDFLLKHFGQL